MGVNVKLADAREVNGRKWKAGEVVNVSAGEARVLVAVGAGVKVADEPALENKPAVVPAPIKPGTAGQKG